MGGKRLRRGNGRSPTSIIDRTILLRRIKTLNLNSSGDPDHIIQILRDHYPDYARIKLQPFSARLHQLLQNLRKEETSKENSVQSFSSHDSLTSTSDDGDDDDDDEKMKIEPEFDVTKSMLLEKYVKQAEQSVRKVNLEKNVEIEEVADKKRKVGVGVGVAMRNDDRGGGMSGEIGRGGPRFSDFGGMEKVVEDLKMEVIVPFCFPEVPRRLGVSPIAGILLHGPPGCGKTKLAHAIANEIGAPFYKICATEVVSGVSGASEENIRDLFNKAYRTTPSVVFIDEIDAIASKRENLQREMERRIVTQLMNCMDESYQNFRAIDSDYGREAFDRTSDKPGYVLVIGATNRPDAVDQALRRPGRFDKEIALGVPNENARAEILSVLTRNLRIDGKVDNFLIAKLTAGFVGADLAALVNKAGNMAMKRVIDKRRSQLSRGHEEIIDWSRHPWSPEEIENLSIIMLDFEEATKLVQPSTRREGFSSIPNIKWENIGGLDSLRKAFDQYIIQPIKHPENYEGLGVDIEVGVLLYGPPGCGKTLIAKAVANEAGANFIHIKGPDIVSKYVGDSEQEVRTIFSRARTCSPCIIFFDEMDALTRKRGKEGAWVVEGVVNQLLVELDGADQRNGVYVIGATNRLDEIDRALLRPGRFGELFYVPLPSADERVLILKALTRKMCVSPDFDYNAFAYKEACRNFSGDDLKNLVKKAALIALEEKQMHVDQGIPYDKSLVIKTSHFEKALEKIVPSVSEEQRRYYEAMSKNFRAS